MTFTYNYSAAAQKEVQEIRKKYLPPEENKLEELKRLDRRVQMAGTMEALIAGILGMLIFGVGLCMALEVLRGGMVFGLLVAFPGVLAMLAAYPLHKALAERARAELAPRILRLADEIQHKN